MKIFRYSFYATYILGLLPTLVRADLPAGNPVTFDEISRLTGVVVQFLIGISMVIAVGFIVISGIAMMTAQGNPLAFTKAQTRLKHAIWGSFVVLGVGVIINTILALVTRDFFCQFSVVGICLIP